MVPEGWIEESIRSAALLITKGATPTTYGYDFVERSDTSIRFVGAYNCSFDGYFKSDSEKWISIEADQMLKRSRLSLGDSIICIVGNTIGSSFLVHESVLPANINQNVAVIRPDGNILNSVYLHFWIMSPYIQWQVLQEASTQAQPSLSLKQVGEFKILLPPLPEQKKIAQILSTWDKAITTTEQLLVNSQQQKKALMQQLLTGKKRLLDDNGVRFCGEWESKSLSDIAEVYQPKTISQSILTETGYPVYGANGIIGFYEEFNHATEQIAVTCRGSTCGVVNWTQAQSWITGNAMVINTDNFPAISKKFLFYVLDGSNLSYLISGSGQPQITGSIKTHVVKIPALEEQQKIAAVLSTADQEISALQQKLEALKQEKKALMQQLLTGKRRVKIDDKEVA
jgi:type I restriction enzyme S subunit